MYNVKYANYFGWYNSKITNFQDYALTLKFNSRYKITCLNKIVGAKREHNLNNMKNLKTKIIQFNEYKLLLRYARRFIPKNKTLIYQMNKNSIQF